MNANDKKRAGCRGCPHYLTNTDKYVIGGCDGAGYAQDLRNVHTCPRKLPTYRQAQKAIRA